MGDRIGRDELRTLIRATLREALGQGAAQAPKDGPPAAPAKTTNLAERLKAGKPVDIAIATDDDLTRFARDVAEAASHADPRAILLSGQARFRLTGAKPNPASAPSRSGAFHWDKGVLSEAKLTEIARNHTRLVLGPNAVLTPLARDRAREVKLELVRQKP
jgi:hypothetical protein